MRTEFYIRVLSLCSTVFGGCIAQFTLDQEEVGELKNTPDQKVSFFLANDDVVDAKQVQYVSASDSTDGILGKGTRTVTRTRESSDFRGFLPVAVIDSLSLRNLRWQCYVRDGTVVGMSEEDAIRVTPSHDPGFWIVGGTRRRHSGELFRGFLPDSAIVKVKGDKLSVLGTVGGVAILTILIAWVLTPAVFPGGFHF